VLNAVAGGAASTADVRQAFARLRAEGAVEVSAALTALFGRGWVRADQGRLSLTPDGAAARERVALAARSQRERLTDGIEPEQYQATIATLRQMARNLAD
jgi:DNA-binding MarR family transcriptional regulator